MSGREGAGAAVAAVAAGTAPAADPVPAPESGANDVPRLTNRLTHLAVEARGAFARHRAARAESVAAWLETGRLLVEAHALCPHGHWLLFLGTAGIARLTAQRMIRLVEAGLDADRVLAQGGIRASLEQLSAPPARPAARPDRNGDGAPARPRDGTDYRAVRRERRQQLRESGVCIECGAERARAGLAMCRTCAGDRQRRARRRRGLALIGEQVVDRAVLADLASADAGRRRRRIRALRALVRNSGLDEGK